MLPARLYTDWIARATAPPMTGADWRSGCGRTYRRAVRNSAFSLACQISHSLAHLFRYFSSHSFAHLRTHQSDHLSDRPFTRLRSLGCPCTHSSPSYSLACSLSIRLSACPPVSVHTSARPSIRLRLLASSSPHLSLCYPLGHSPACRRPLGCHMHVMCINHTTAPGSYSRHHAQHVQPPEGVAR